MLNYAVCEINGKQYKISPNQPLNVDFLGEGIENIEVNVLLTEEEGKIKLGNPYLKDKLDLKILESVKGKKVRVAKFHAKANFRKVTGFRPKYSRVVLDLKKKT